MTKMMSLFPCVTLVLTSLVMCSDSASILFVLPVSTRSHKNVFAPLAQALAARGHAVTMFSSHLSKHGLDGVREFAVPGMMDRMEVGSKILWSQMGQTGVVNNLFTLFFLGKLGSEACDKMLSMPEVQAALRGQVRYDLVVQSVFFEESCLALAGKSDTPFIYMSTAGNWAHLAHAMGHAELTSAEPSILLTFTDHMTFWERVVNTVQYHAGNAVHHLLTLPMHERVLHKHWPDAPPVRDLHANASMAFLNTAPGVDYRNTLPATFLEVGGMHCQAPKDIPKHNHLPSHCQRIPNAITNANANGTRCQRIQKGFCNATENGLSQIF
ncbi:unnamed protein product [Notodromas monacha]|uniref:UDP-glucuronosyltransferase n=1 Tax=Notodromas monacha TaxID=399045 RepID=A0A7R9GIL1_9CRUS|nr:unnamed protein product [Notodromas monacha]CAG0922578.1 unnamed protein product [Notodromas monacha]